jgi:hypothetical protein
MKTKLMVVIECGWNSPCRAFLAWPAGLVHSRITSLES